MNLRENKQMQQVLNELNNRQKSTQLTDIIYLFCISYFFLPIVGACVPSIFVYISFILGALLSLSQLGTIKNAKKYNGIFFVFLPNILYALLVLYNKSSLDFFKYLYGLLQLFVIQFIAIIYIESNDRRKQKNVLYCILFMFFLTGLSSSIASIFHPNLLREMTAFSNSDLYIQFRYYNVGEFSFLYQFILLFPIVIFLSNYKRISVFLTIILILYAFFVVLLSHFTTALLTYIILLFFFFTGKLTRKKLIYIIVLLFSAICILRSTLGGLIDNNIFYIEDASYRYRLEYISAILKGEEISDTTNINSGGRLDLYSKSINSFFNQWITGSWDQETTGGHSYFFDNLSLFGIVGLISLIYSVIYIFRIFLTRYTKEKIYPYVLCSFFVMIIYSFINPKFYTLIFTFVYPLICINFSSTDNEEEVEMEATNSLPEREIFQNN